MGISVTKQRRTDSSRGTEEPPSLEFIADEYMKQDSYRRSANKYGVDLRDDEIAEDMPLDAYSSQPNTPSSDNVPPPLDSRTPIRWQRGGLIGSGAFGKVYLGLNLDTGELLAVKQVTLVGENSQRLKEVESFEQEIDVMRGLSHENIVQYRGVSLEEDHLNIFLEYVPGGSISSLLVKFVSLGESVIRAYTRQILSGLEYLHLHHIIHRDIKGANILVDNNGVIKLADFGASKKLQGLLNATGGLRSLKGTPYYMAPEVIRQTGHGKQADIWSVGCTVFEMFTGKPPWCDIEDQVSAMFHIASQNSGPTIPDWISPEAQDFLSLCFKSDPQDRPSATKLLEHEWLRKEFVPKSPSNKQGQSSATNSPRHSPLPRNAPSYLGPQDRSYSMPSSPVVAAKNASLKNSASPNKSIGKVYPETAVRVRSASVETSHPASPMHKDDFKARSGSVIMLSINPVEEPSWAWSEENRKNMNFLESKLKKAENNSPGSTWRKSSVTENDSQGLDEITAFVRKSAVNGIKRLVSENALIQSIRDMSDLKSTKMSNEEVIETLIRRADHTRDQALRVHRTD